MIRNDRQYKISRARAERFADLIRSNAEPSRPQDEWSSIELDAIKSQLDDLRREINEYEELKDGGVTNLEIDSFEELPMVLVKARIASGMTQRELAERLGLKEQQIQRYEQNEYSGVSIDRIRAVIKALDLSVTQNVLLPENHRSVSELTARLNQVGIDQSLIEHRLMPSEFERIGAKGRLQALVDRISRVYGWHPATLMGDAHLELPQSAIDVAQFKLPSKVDKRRLSGYCIYAHYIALLALQATPHLETRVLPGDSSSLRKELFGESRRIDLQSLLSFLWRVGIVVVPLFDSGLFHGACWRISGRNVVVLKQRTKSIARWMVDVLHEYYHLISTPDSDVAILEPVEDHWSDNDLEDDEAEATDFAGDVLLQGRADELAVVCQRESNGRVEQLKSTVERVARREGVDIGVLANYMAYRLQQNKINWWGAANNLQPEGPDPGDVVRAKLLSEVDLNLLNEIDRDLFMTALRPLEVLDGQNN